jgi:hypothetical protein
MAASERVCPFCGELPGTGVFCAACGRNLSAVEQLPTRAEWQAEHQTAAATAVAAPAAAMPRADPGRLADRCAEATADFLAAMHAAGDPGTTEMPITGRTGFFRTPSVRGWKVRPVARDEETEDLEVLKRFEPGLLLTVAGAWHRIDSEVRGWGQRDFPVFHESVAEDPIEMPVEERLIEELAALRAGA